MPKIDVCNVCQDDTTNLYSARDPADGSCETGQSKAKKLPPCPPVHYCIHPITKVKTRRIGSSCPPVDICDVCEDAATGLRLPLHPDTNDCAYRGGLTKVQVLPPCPAVNWCTHPLTGVKTFRTGDECPKVDGKTYSLRFLKLTRPLTI